jgi:endogenous inhibitor of DNA gyrase (YacG/DUF329 family)
MPDTAPNPPRDATVTAPACPSCQHPIPAGHERPFCSPRCRQAGYRRRHGHTPEPPPPPGRPRRETTVYACPACDTPALGEQRCPDCNTFTRRIGRGGHCPPATNPITLEELLQTPLDNT